MQFTTQPYPGLRPFLASETDIFFGRDKQTDALLNRLQTVRFIAVLGGSGCGKSSLVRAGLVPALEAGFMVTAGVHWDVVLTHPGGAPIANLAKSMVASPRLNVGRPDDPALGLSVAVNLRRGPRSLIELLREGALQKDRRLCLIVDQFEELFRFKNEAALDESQAFVDLLLTTAESRELEVYIVVTMRSDYLGESSQLAGLAQAINDGLYLTPHLTRKEAEEAIVGPARVCGGELDSRLVNCLLNDFGPKPDHLPLLQHVLMRMWNRRAPGDEADAPKQKFVLGVEDYEAAGGMSGALSQHADLVLAELTDEQRGIAKAMFQRLTLLEAGRDRRTPASVHSIATLANVPVPEVIAVADAFRGPGRSFIIPAIGETLSGESRLDIGHESLIRRWPTLLSWATEESQQAELLRQLANTAELWKQGQAALWRNPDLERAQRWRNTANCTPAWAERYCATDRLPAVLAFIEESAQAEQTRKLEAQRLRERQLRRTQLWAFGFATLAAVLGAGYLVFYDLYLRKSVELCNDFERRRGIPHCIGRLTEKAASQRVLTFQIVRNGRLGHVVQMNAIDSRGALSPMHETPTYIGYGKEGYDARRETTWNFTYYDGESPGFPEGRVVRETQLDKHGKRVRELVYEPSVDPLRRIAYYLGPDGFPLVPSDGPEVFVELVYDNQGNEVATRYRTRDGTPIAGRDDAFGQLRRFDAQGRVTRMVSIDVKSEPMDDSYGNAVAEIEPDALGSPAVTHARDVQNRPTLTRQGWGTTRQRFDPLGRPLEIAYFDAVGKPIPTLDGYHRATYAYDRQGNCEQENYFSEDGKPDLNNRGCFGYRYRFDQAQVHFAVSSSCVDEKGKPVRDVNGIATRKFKPDSDGNTINEAFFDGDDKPTLSVDGYASVDRKYDADGNIVSTEFLGAEGKPTTLKSGYARHDDTYNHLRLRTSLTYIDKDGKPVVLPEKGYASETWTYVGGRLTKESFFDADGKPVAGHGGYAAVEYIRNALGRATDEILFGPNGVASVGRDGYAVLSQEFNAAGLAIRSTQRSSSWNPIANKMGIAEWRYTRNFLGKITEERYYGADGKPTMNKDGIAAARSEYDVRSKLISHETIGPTGALAPDENGIAKFVQTFDSRGNVRSIEYYGADGQLTCTPWKAENPSDGGYARMETEYDRANRETDERFFGNERQRILHPEKYWRKHNEYDAAGNNIETRFYGLNDEPVVTGLHYFRAVRQYNRSGLATSVEYFDVNGKLTLSNEKVARLVHEYDAYGHLTATSAYGVDGKPVLATDLSAKVVYQYDDLGRETRRSYLDEQGNPVNAADGYYSESMEYGPSGEVVRIEAVGADSKPAVDKGIGAARLLVSYDTLARVSERRWFNAKGEQTNRETSSYTSFGELAVKKVFDAKGRLSLQEAYEYDELRRLEKETYERPKEAFFGIEEYRYNRRGALSWTIYWQRDGMRAIKRDGNRECYAHRFSFSRDNGKIAECFTRPPTAAELDSD